MDLRKTFNTDEYNYDRSRPGYPKELFDDIFDYVNLSENCNVLEIGIGTGQATLPFLKQGCNVTAIQLIQTGSSCRWTSGFLPVCRSTPKGHSGLDP